MENSFNIVNNRSIVAGLSSPMGKAETQILSKNAGATTGVIAIDLPLAPLAIGNSVVEHLIFSQFTTDLTSSNGSRFILAGNSTAITNTPAGQVKLRDIEFVVPAGLLGLEGLTKFPTEILSVDVLGGSKDAIILAINVGLNSPSNLDLKVGNVTFQLYGGEKGKDYFGTAILPVCSILSLSSTETDDDSRIELTFITWLSRDRSCWILSS